MQTGQRWRRAGVLGRGPALHRPADGTRWAGPGSRRRVGAEPGRPCYADELPGAEAAIVYSRRAPDDADRPAGRIGPADLQPVSVADATAYVCGSAGFADAASHLLVDLDVSVERIRAERFGPTG